MSASTNATANDDDDDGWTTINRGGKQTDDTLSLQPQCGMKLKFFIKHHDLRQDSHHIQQLFETKKQEKTKPQTSKYASKLQKNHFEIVWNRTTIKRGFISDKKCIYSKENYKVY